MAGLTTHVLDTVNGRPAAGVEIELFELGEDGTRRRIAHMRTNKDGRTDAPLMPAAEARVGRFELEFHIGDYFRGRGAAVSARLCCEPASRKQGGGANVPSGWAYGS